LVINVVPQPKSSNVPSFPANKVIHIKQGLKAEYKHLLL